MVLVHRVHSLAAAGYVQEPFAVHWVWDRHSLCRLGPNAANCRRGVCWQRMAQEDRQIHVQQSVMQVCAQPCMFVCARACMQVRACVCADMAWLCEGAGVKQGAREEPKESTTRARARHGAGTGSSAV